jgi:hypothetical protein
MSYIVLGISQNERANVKGHPIPMTSANDDSGGTWALFATRAEAKRCAERHPF